jgi:hypothetical protein
MAKTGANSGQVVANIIPGDISGVDTAVLTSVAASITTVVIKASNPLRKALIVYNDSTSPLYLAFAATSSLSAFTLKITGNSSYEFQYPAYTGVVAGIWDAATGNARVTEVT